jgi:propionyl-CoA synthetase
MMLQQRSMRVFSSLGVRAFASSGINKSNYMTEKNLALSDPRQYWDRVAKKMGLFWSKPYTNVLNSTKAPFYSWFDDGMTNMSFNCLDLHVQAGKGDTLALIYDSPVAGVQRTLTYNELLDQVKRFSKVLRNINIKPGDRVIIYMPNSVEAVVAMLACARIGATHSVVFGGFAANELATRIRDCRPKAIIAASASLEGNKIINYYNLVEEALKIAEDDTLPVADRVQHCIINQIDQLRIPLKAGRDMDMSQEILNTHLSAQEGECTFVPSTHPLYILYTSGTTGKPKGVLRDTGGYMVALKNSMSSIFGCRDNDVYWAASDVGWVVGHSYSVYGPLLQGITTLIYHGKPVGTPDEAQYWRLINKYQVNIMFTAPTAIRAIKRIDDHGATHSPAHSLTHSLTHLLTYLLTHLLTYLLTHSHSLSRRSVKYDI